MTPETQNQLLMLLGAGGGGGGTPADQSGGPTVSHCGLNGASD